MRFRLRRFSILISAVALMAVTLVVSHLDYSAAPGGSPGRVTLRVSVETSLEDARRGLAETGEALTRQELFDVADLQASASSWRGTLGCIECLDPWQLGWEQGGLL